MKTTGSFQKGHLTNQKHGAYGIERRVVQGLELPQHYIQRRNDIIRRLGYDPEALPAGPLGEYVLTVADNGCLAEDFRDARHWAQENSDPVYSTLAQRSGWRNDKYAGQLLELHKLQASADDGSIEAAIASARGQNDHTHPN